jgi:hypothetical protein
MTESEDQYCKKTADNTPVSGNRHYLRAPKTRYQSNGWEFFTVDLLKAMTKSAHDRWRSISFL